MQVFRQIDQGSSALVGWGVRTMLLAAEADVDQSKVAARLAGLGGVVTLENDPFDAVEAMTTSHTGFGLFVVECDDFGGLEATMQIVSMLRRAGGAMPVILLTSDCAEQSFPAESNEPIILRAPLSALALRVGFEFALRDRLVYEAA